MKYKILYNKLINRAITRIIDDNEYYEKHHINPRCLGGTDEDSNIVKLTAREHFIAHLCLVKIYPTHHGLIKAAIMMACGSSTQQRSGNRIYAWMRAKHSVAMSYAQAGSKNSQFKTAWVFNEQLKESKKIKKDELDYYIATGWVIGRVLDFNAIYQTCEVCNTNFINSRVKRKTCGKNCHTKLRAEKDTLFTGREEEFKQYYKQTNSMNKALQLMGFKGAVGRYYRWATSIINITTKETQ